MNEGNRFTAQPKDVHTASEAEIKKVLTEEKVAIAFDCIQENIVFAYPGIAPETYTRLKVVDDEYPGMATPIDALLARFKTEGIKIMFGRNPADGNLHVVPAHNTEIGDDSFRLKDLDTTHVHDPRLRRLILLDTPGI